MRDASDKHPLSELITLECKFCKQEKMMKEALKKIYERQNPNKKVETVLRNPKAILEEMKALDIESQVILNSILELI